jgi:hypothetical protein
MVSIDPLPVRFSSSMNIVITFTKKAKAEAKAKDKIFNPLASTKSDDYLVSLTY